MKKFYDNCQVFTPDKIVDKTLDIVEYKNNLYGKKVLENSCGDGQFLQKIAERYILDCLKKGMRMDDISKGLENDLYGVEIDEKHQDKIFEFSQFPDINQLFYVTEILITDYSSNIYEFSLQRKPIIFYAFDKEKYELIRSVHRTLDEHAAGKVCKTMSEVIDTIKTKDFQLEKLYQFVDENFDRSEGLASDKVIDYILLNKNL